MKKSVIAAVMVIIIIILVISTWLFYKDKNKEQDLTLYGNVDIRQVSLAFEESGRIQTLYVQEGDKVKQGQILARLKIDALDIQKQQAQAQLNVQEQTILEQKAGNRPEEIAQAKAQLVSAQAQLEKANKDYQRLKVLNNSILGQAISKQELDSAQSNQAIAKASVKEREANLQLLKKGVRAEERAATKAQYQAIQANLNLIQYQISQSELRSPANAVVRARLQEVGDMTTAQKTVYTLALADPKWVRVYANEQDLSRIKMGAAAQVIRDSQPNQPITGKIGYISSVAEFTPKTVQTEDIRTTLVYEVRIYVSDPNDQLKMGQPVTVRIAKAN
ncbi:efflux RND transporter periplasmic adaptor subunit [Acinetobacter sp. ANC 5502]